MRRKHTKTAAWRALPLLVLLAGCGQKGPLFLPDDKRSVVPPQPAAPTDTVSPEDQSKDRTKRTQSD